ncbi:MAG: hypothetical protein Q8T13_15495 [Acidobacteriota bacterium]|nr:hypothetical protein [Acidobacteriota bacterium]
MKKQMRAWVVLSALVVAVPAAAQEATTTKPVNMSDMRHHIYVMEGALARAVDYGAKNLNREILAVMPGVFILAGEAQARGVYLDGYGVYFDVQVPMMRQSMMWSLRTMIDQDNAAAERAINDMRKVGPSITDPAARAVFERSLKQLESQAAPPSAYARSGNQATSPAVAANVVLPDGPGGIGAGAAAGGAPPAKAWAQDPNRAYTEAVTKALVDAIIDYSTPMTLGPDQWLTVAARDNEGRDTLAPQDPLEEVVTMIYRIRGADLMDYRAGRISRDEARKRVQVSQF